MVFCLAFQGAVEDVELMHERCLEHQENGNSKNEIYKAEEEAGRRRRENMKKIKLVNK